MEPFYCLNEGDDEELASPIQPSKERDPFMRSVVLVAPTLLFPTRLEAAI